MNEDKEFVNYAWALYLKKAGYNEPCLGYYHLGYGDKSFELTGSDIPNFYNSKNNYRIGAPKKNEAENWLKHLNNKKL